MARFVALITFFVLFMPFISKGKSFQANLFSLAFLLQLTGGNVTNAFGQMVRTSARDSPLPHPPPIALTLNTASPSMGKWVGTRSQCISATARPSSGLKNVITCQRRLNLNTVTFFFF